MVALHPIRKYRDERGITQEALAKELDVHPFTVSRWETGARRVDQDLLGSIVERTGIPARELRPDLVELVGGGQ